MFPTCFAGSGHDLWFFARFFCICQFLVFFRCSKFCGCQTYMLFWTRKHLELFVALWGLRRAQIGQHNGMIFCMSGICAWITGPTPVEFLLGQRNAWLNTGISLLTLQIYLPNAGWGGHLHGNHVQHILRVDARNKPGTRNWKCFAGTRLWAIGRLLREMRPDGTLFCRVSWISALCNYFFDVLWEMLVGCTGFSIFWCTYIFSLFRLRPYIGLACGRWGWLDLTLDQRGGRNLGCHLDGKTAHPSAISFPTPSQLCRQSLPNLVKESQVLHSPDISVPQTHLDTGLYKTCLCLEAAQKKHFFRLGWSMSSGKGHDHREEHTQIFCLNQSSNINKNKHTHTLEKPQRARYKTSVRLIRWCPFRNLLRWGKRVTLLCQLRTQQGEPTKSRQNLEPWTLSN